MSPADRRRAVSRLFLALVSTAGALIAAECALRLHHLRRAGTIEEVRRVLAAGRAAGPRQEGSGETLEFRDLIRGSANPGLVFELKPLVAGRFKGGIVRINSWGFRGPEVELVKPSDTLRIVGIGDSVMFGWGVDDDQTYLATLERRLASRPGPRYQTLNLAVPGYNTAMEVESLAARGLAFEPDLVLLHFFPNDLDLPGFLQDPRVLFSPRRGLLLVDLLRAAWRRRGGDPLRRDLHRSDRLDRLRDDPETVRAAYRHLVGEEALRGAMARLAALGREHSFRVVVLMLEEAGLGDLVRATAARHGFTLLEPRLLFEADLRRRAGKAVGWSQAFWISPRDPHPNPAAHALFAEALLPVIRD